VVESDPHHPLSIVQGLSPDPKDPTKRRRFYRDKGWGLKYYKSEEFRQHQIEVRARSTTYENVISTCIAQGRPNPFKTELENTTYFKDYTIKVPFKGTFPAWLQQKFTPMFQKYVLILFIFELRNNSLNRFDILRSVHLQFLTSYGIMEYEESQYVPPFTHSLIVSAFKYLIHKHSIPQADDVLVTPRPSGETLLLYQKFDKVWAEVGSDFMPLEYINTTMWSNTFEYLATIVHTNIELHFTVFFFDVPFRKPYFQNIIIEIN
jgi:hypothetical protein